MKRWLALVALVICLGAATWLFLRRGQPTSATGKSATAPSDTPAGDSRSSAAAGGRKPAAAPAPPVTIAEVKAQDVPIELHAFGTVEASNSVDVVPQVSGQITEVHFVEGAFVKKGDLLFSVDTRPYRASLAAARAELAKSSALAQQASSEAERYAELASQGVATTQQLTQAKADAASARAQVEQVQAQISSASLNVNFTRITAPIDGKTGSLLVHAGNVIQGNAAQPLVVIRSLSPVQVRFAVPQQHLADIRSSLAAEPLPVRAAIRGDTGQPAQGQLMFLENSVDTATGTISVKATFLNRDLALWPGASVDVVLTLGKDSNALVVPAEAVRESQDGSYVFVVGPDDKVKQQPVQVARTTEKLALLREGVSAQDRVVTDGFVRLRDGVKVTLQPPPQAQLTERIPAPPAAGAVP
jgi:multidrug efflux system membrane fusion protein